MPIANFTQPRDLDRVSSGSQDIVATMIFKCERPSRIAYQREHCCIWPGRRLPRPCP